MPRFEPLPERRPAIVAGASSGIGEASAIELAAHGFPVALGARRVEKLDDIVGKINADSRRLFTETLEAIRVNFQGLYRKAFGGGKADLVLEHVWRARRFYIPLGRNIPGHLRSPPLDHDSRLNRIMISSLLVWA